MTGLELINSSLRLINVLASGETAEASEATDALAILNQLLESWALESNIVPYLTTAQYTWSAGQASQTIGIGGDFNATRPIKIETAFVRIGSIDYPLLMIGNDEYQKIVMKSIQTPIPEVLYYQPTNPLGTLFIYTIPSANTTISLSSWSQLTAITLAGQVTLAPGFERALRYNLAIELANEYGKSVKPETAQMALKSLGNIKNANAPNYIMYLDPAMSDISNNNSNSDGRFNIYRGW